MTSTDWAHVLAHFHLGATYLPARVAAVVYLYAFGQYTQAFLR